MGVKREKKMYMFTCWILIMHTLYWFTLCTTIMQGNFSILRYVDKYIMLDMGLDMANTV